MLGISFILDLVFIYFSSYLNSPPPSLFVCVCDRERERERERREGGGDMYIFHGNCCCFNLDVVQYYCFCTDILFLKFVV